MARATADAKRRGDPQSAQFRLSDSPLYLIVRKRFGTFAATISALTLAVFPAFVAVSRDNNLDTLLILLMTLACGAALRASETGRVRTLLGSAVLVALAFNTKALAAYLVVPGIAAGYLWCAPGSLRSRVGRLLIAGLPDDAGVGQILAGHLHGQGHRRVERDGGGRHRDRRLGRRPGRGRVGGEAGQEANGKKAADQETKRRLGHALPLSDVPIAVRTHSR